MNLLEDNGSLRYTGIYDEDGVLTDIQMNYRIDTNSGFVVDSEYLSNMIPSCISVMELYAIIDLLKDR